MGKTVIILYMVPRKNAQVPHAMLRRHSLCSKCIVGMKTVRLLETTLLHDPTDVILQQTGRSVMCLLFSFITLAACSAGIAFKTTSRKFGVL